MIMPGEWLFQQDNAPCHRAATSLAWFKSKKIKCLEWPPSSPDLNPIENIWALIDKELAKINIWSVDQLKQEIKRIWFSLDKILCKTLVTSLPRRIKSVLKAKGKSSCKY